jgi:hypothetical protein
MANAAPRSSAPSPASLRVTGQQQRSASAPLWLGGLHLAVLWGFAIVQPLFADLERNAEFFVARDDTSTDILLFAFVVTLVPPALLVGIEALAALARPVVARGLHIAFVGVLAAAFALGVLKRVLPDTSPILIPAAAALGAAAGAGYTRAGGVRMLLTVLAPAPAVFLVVFLLFSPVAELVVGSERVALASGVSSDVPVVLAIFDELPAISLMDAQGGIDARSYPAFGALAATSTWFRNATTVADGTYVAVPAILSGRRPAARLPTAHHYPHSVFTLVGRRYALHVLEPITHVCPPELCAHRARASAATRRDALVSDLGIVVLHQLLPADLTRWLPPIDRDYEDFGGEERGVQATAAPTAPRLAPGEVQIAGNDLFAQRLRDAERFVRSVRRPGTRPPLYMAHLEVPHVPWRLLPSGRQYPVPGPSLPGLDDQTWTRDACLVGQATQRHLLQVGYADRLLGRFIARLRAAGLWDRALVIVTADHGVSLRPGGSRRPVTRADFPGIAGVPLFVKLPHQRRARISDAPAQTIDILPTIAHVLGARGFPAGDGVPLTAPHPATTPSVRSGRRGQFVSVPLRDFVRARDAERHRQRRLLAASPSLVLRTTASGRALRVRRDAARAVIENATAFAHVAPGSRVLPVYVAGHFTAGGRPGLRIGVAVNGRLRGLGCSYRTHGQLRFSALIPPQQLRAGRNRIEVVALGHRSQAQLLAAAG